MATEQLLPLVDYIAYAAKCAEISDLHQMDRIQKRRALHGLARVKENTYPIEQWNDAVAYIAGSEPQASICEARQVLEAFLND